MTTRRRKQLHHKRDTRSGSTRNRHTANAEPRISPKTFRATTTTSNAMICAAFGFLLYVNAIWECGFCYDDWPAIKANRDVLNTKGGNDAGIASSSLLEVFRHDFWGADIRDEDSHKSYRPLASLAFRFDALVARCLGSPGVPWVFHLLNALLYAVTCWLVVEFMLPGAAIDDREDDSDGGRRATLAHNQRLEAVLLSGLWFAAHPIHTESVTGLVGRADILAAIFCVLGAKLHAGQRSLKSAVCFVAACLCKETSVMIPVVLAAADIGALLSAPSKIINHGVARPTGSVVSLGLQAACLASVSIGYLLFRSWLFSGTETGQTLAGSVPVTDNFIQHLGPGDKLRTAMWIQAKYVQLLLWPDKLSCDYGLGVIDPVRDWVSLEILCVAMVAVAVVVWALHGAARLRRAGDVVPLLALGWTLGPLVPASHVVDIGTVMAERLLFLPSIGATMLLCRVLGVHIADRHYRAARIVLVVCILMFVHKTVTRNPDWADSKRLFKVDLATYPRSLKMLISNAKYAEYSEENTWNYALTALRILDDNSEVLRTGVVDAVRCKILLTMADIKIDASSPREALLYVSQVIGFGNGLPDKLWVMAHGKKGKALLKLGIDTNDPAVLNEAVAAYRLATQMGKIVKDSEWIDINDGMGRVFFELRDPISLNKAAAAFRIVTEMGDTVGDDERWSDIQFMTGKTLIALGAANSDPALMSEAAAAFRIAIKKGNISGDERWSRLHEEMGMTLLQLAPATRDLAMVNEAEAAFRIAIGHGEGKSHLYCMLATTLAMLNRDTEAQAQFQECFQREEEGGRKEKQRNDRFQYRINYALLMQKLSGVESSDAAAAHVWGRSAVEAINVVLGWPNIGVGGNMLPEAQVQRWVQMKHAIIKLMGDDSKIDSRAVGMHD